MVKMAIVWWRWRVYGEDSDFMVSAWWMGFKAMKYIEMAMDQYLYIPFLVGWTSIYQLFWCELQGYKVLTYPQIMPSVLVDEDPQLPAILVWPFKPDGRRSQIRGVIQKKPSCISHCIPLFDWLNAWCLVGHVLSGNCLCGYHDIPKLAYSMGIRDRNATYLAGREALSWIFSLEPTQLFIWNIDNKRKQEHTRT